MFEKEKMSERKVTLPLSFFFSSFFLLLSTQLGVEAFGYLRHQSQSDVRQKKGRRESERESEWNERVKSEWRKFWRRTLPFSYICSLFSLSLPPLSSLTLSLSCTQSVYSIATLESSDHEQERLFSLIVLFCSSSKCFSIANTLSHFIDRSMTHQLTRLSPSLSFFLSS